MALAALEFQRHALIFHVGAHGPPRVDLAVFRAALAQRGTAAEFGRQTPDLAPNFVQLVFAEPVERHIHHIRLRFGLAVGQTGGPVAANTGVYILRKDAATAGDPLMYEQLKGKGGTVKWSDAINWPTKQYPRLARGDGYESDAEDLRSARRHELKPSVNVADPQFPKSPHWYSNGFWVGMRLVSPVKQPSRCRPAPA